MKILFNIILFFICFSFILSNPHEYRKCSLANSDLRLRPSTDENTLSPSGHFLIHYDNSGTHAPLMEDFNQNNIPDYIDEVGIIADSSRYILVDIMGYLPEISDSDELYDIYIQDRPSGYYGVNYQDDVIAGASYIVIDNEYEPGEFFTFGINAMRLTVAHEYFHAIQRAYRTSPSFGDTYFWEMSATWIEDIIVPDGDDYLFWADDFLNDPNQNISDTDGYSIALFGHYLTNIIDHSSNELESTIIRKFWEAYSSPSSAFNSMNIVLQNEYQTDFSNSWLDFTSRNHFNGIYENMNNNLYYHIDQQHLPSLSTSINFLNQDLNIDLMVTEESSAFKTLYVNEICSINIESTITPSSSEYNRMIAIESENLGLNNLGSITDTTYFLDPGTYIHLSYSGYNDSNINTNIYYNSEIDIVMGDANLNNEVNVVDVVLFINFIFEQVSFNQLQLETTDVNFDQEWNVVDIVNIVNLILN